MISPYDGVVSVVDGTEQQVASWAIASDSGFDHAVPAPELGRPLGGIAGIASLALVGRWRASRRLRRDLVLDRLHS